MTATCFWCRRRKTSRRSFTAFWTRTNRFISAREEQAMSTYSAPVRDMQFAIEELADLKSIASLAGCEDATPDLVNSVLEEAAKFAGGVWAPLDRVGDVEGARWNDGQVAMPDGFHAAYRQFVEAGWNGLRFGAEYGGQGLPKLVDAAVMEMWNGANLGFSLVSLLTQGAIEAILLRGTDEQKQKYLPRLVTGEWTGTMNLTEPQAGSDLALLRASAVREGDHYRIRGQKIFISFGEHDLADNIIHLVLARTPNAPEGVKGISLFLVPKFLVNDDGSLGERNDVSCVSIEHKLGIHASPTATLAFGDKGGAIGYLLGEENRGLESMFIMMNEARFAVGMQGVAVAERAYQRALDWAKQRLQGKDAANGGHVVPMRMRGGARRRWRICSSPSSRAGARNRRSTSRPSACRFTAEWDTSRRPAPPSTCAMPASPRSTKAPPASRRSTSSGERFCAMTGGPREP